MIELSSIMPFVLASSATPVELLLQFHSCGSSREALVSWLALWLLLYVLLDTVTTAAVGFWHGRKQQNGSQRQHQGTHQAGHVSKAFHHHLPKKVGQRSPQTKAGGRQPHCVKSNK